MLLLWGAVMSERNTFFCTRSSLARQLIKAGAEAKRTINPYNVDYPAWEFVVDDLVLSIATEYYKNIDKPLPKSLMRAAADGKQP